ncbi:MAG: nucleotidyl transferase AbiEii/AbiGii toxin family protein [Alphaproteobacteria bacterium]
MKMDKIALESNLERKSLFIAVADKTGFSNFIVEKDFWVSWVLGKIFSDNELSQILCFKGGTSLSKAFGLIDRFSEDVDLILSLKVVLRTSEKLEQESNTKQNKFKKQLEKRATDYISTELKSKIKNVLGKICSIVSDESDKHVLLVKYPRVFDYSYVKPNIKLEIGPLALWNPNKSYSISSFIAQELPELNLENPIVSTVKPERTFWEKITILHHEHYRPETSSLPHRYSRHYYDIFKMGQHSVKNKALANLKLLEEVVDFKNRFYSRGWANYDKAVPGTIKLLPAKHNLSSLRDDYTDMEKMLFGEIPTFDEILMYLKKLENEINMIKNIS